MRKGHFIGEGWLREKITRRARELNLDIDTTNYLLQDFNSRDEVVNDVMINALFYNAIVEMANVSNISIEDTDRHDLSEDFIAGCCFKMYNQLQQLDVKPEEVIKWFESAWEFTKARMGERVRILNIIKCSMKKKSLN